MMSMLSYPPTRKRDATERSVLRLVGSVLAFLTILLALLCVIFHHSLLELILAVIMGLFALRVLLFWLENTPPHRQPPAKETTRTPAPPQEQPASLSSQSWPLSPLAAEQHLPHSVPLPPKLPRSVRPQHLSQAAAVPARPAPRSQQGRRPLPASRPPALWLPPLSASVPLLSPAPAPQPSELGDGQDDDGNR